MISVIISVFPDKLAYTIKISPIAIPPSTIIIINNENQYQLKSIRKCDKSLKFTTIKFAISAGLRKSWIALLKHTFLTTKKVDLHNEANLLTTQLCNDIQARSLRQSTAIFFPYTFVKFSLDNTRSEERRVG